MLVKVQPKKRFRVPVDARCISPDNLEGLSHGEISKLEVWEGNRRKAFGELFNFTLEEKGSPTGGIEILMRGDLSKVKGLGSGMTKGTLTVEGNVGMHLGESMKGGVIRVKGNVDSWAGCMMRGGLIEIEGSAGDYIGASYRGSREGMSGGKIIIHGDAGREVGCYMRGGLIRIYGSVGPFVGVHMIDGTILVHGDSAGRAGAEMTGGKIVICGYVPSILPTFTIEDIKSSTKVDGEKIKGPFYRFVGDIADKGEGKLFVYKPKNPHLKFYERYL